MCVCDTETIINVCFGSQELQSKWYACVITTVVVVEEGARTQKILAHAGLTLDPERLVPPTHPLPPSILPALLPPPLVYLGPLFSSLGIIPGSYGVVGQQLVVCKEKKWR